MKLTAKQKHNLIGVTLSIIVFVLTILFIVS